MKVKIRFMNVHRKEAETHIYYFVDKVKYDPLYVVLSNDQKESVRVRQAHLISLEIEEDPETLIL